MSTNPQWNSSLYSPKSPAPASLLGFGYSGGSNSSSNLLSSSGATVNGYNNFSSFGRSNSGSGTFFASQTNSASTQFSINNGQGGSISPTLGSSSIGHFPIGTFNANSAFSEETIKTSPAVHLGNGNVHRDGGSNSPNNLGSRETGIIEKLLVKKTSFYLFLGLLVLIFLIVLCLSIPMDSFSVVNAKLVSSFILVNLTAILNT